MNYESTSEPEFNDSMTWEGIQVNGRTQDPYFQAYGHFGIHEEMLKDKVRTRAYKDAILRNKYLFTGKIVLDLGCGTGILSFFAVKAGAKQVYAIDNADMIEYAAKVAEANNHENITFIKGKIEEVTLPTHVDIIISEWMGYFLLYENMLESLIFARDKWLLPGGMIFPDKARIYIAAIENAKFKDDNIEFWNSVYGIDMSVFRKISLEEAHIEEISSECLLSNSCPILELDLESCKFNDLTFVSGYSLQFTRKDFMHAIVAWFEVGFTHCHKPIYLSTSPRSKLTHWKQTVFYLENSQPIDVGQILKGSVAVRMNPRSTREIDAKFSFHIESKSFDLHTVQIYKLKK